jgi:ABC-type sulfate/molybdate transport systems ATPase subunit
MDKGDLVLETLGFRHLGPISLRVGAGECVGITGPSGSGKSLLLRAVADMEERGGRIFLGDQDVDALSGPQWRRRVGLLPAESAWWFDSVGAHFNGFDPAGLQELGFSPAVMDWEVSRLSSGERQRLGLIRLLSRQPRALLLDEPTANLDAENTGRAESLLRAYQQRHQVPLIWVSHDQAQLKRVADRCFVFDQGMLSPWERF